MNRDELTELLEFIDQQSIYPSLHPMCVMAAYTGVRRSELCRSLASDFDFQAGTILIRERKRSKGKRTTRLVPMTEYVAEIMSDWIIRKPKSPFTFPEDHRCSRNRKEQTDEGCVTPSEATHHFEQVLSKSKWSRLRGWHIFRHSFISNCAAIGVDQRMIDSWVGHQTDEMRKRYTHLFPEIQQHAIASVFD